MNDVLILGANGQVARHTTPVFLRHDDLRLTLYLRRATRLRNPDPGRVTIVEGDVLDLPTLEATLKGQDVVRASREDEDAAVVRQSSEGGDDLDNGA